MAPTAVLSCARPARLAQVIAALQARYGAHIIRIAADAVAASAVGMPPLSTGSLALDLLTGGLPRGQLTEITGPDGAGKGTLAFAALVACQRAGGLVLLVDADHAADPDALAAAGVDVERLILACPTSAVEAWDVLRTLARCGALDLLVLASLNGLLVLPGAGWEPGYLERRLIRLSAVLRGRRTALIALDQPLSEHWCAECDSDGDRNSAGEPRVWSVATVGGDPVARAMALRIALRPAGVQLTPYGAIARVRSRAWVVKHHGSPRGPLILLEIGLDGPRRAAELVLLAEACGCLRHTSLGLVAVETVLGRSAERAALTLEADAPLSAALEAEVRAAWAASPSRPASFVGAMT